MSDSHCARALGSFRNRLGEHNPVTYIERLLGVWGPAHECNLNFFAWYHPHSSLIRVQVNDELRRVAGPSPPGPRNVFVAATAQFPYGRLSGETASRLALITPQIVLDRVRHEATATGCCLLECSVLLAFVEAMVAGVFDKFTLPQLQQEYSRRLGAKVVSEHFSDILGERENMLPVPSAAKLAQLLAVPANGAHNGADRTQVLQQWKSNDGSPNNPAAYAVKMVHYQSLPTTASVQSLTWYQPFAEVSQLTVRDEFDERSRHFIPFAHNAAVYSTAPFANLTPQRASVLASLDGAMLVDALRSRVTAKSYCVLFNQVILSFVDDYLKQRLDHLSYDQLANEYARRRAQTITNSRFPNVHAEH